MGCLPTSVCKLEMIILVNLVNYLSRLLAHVHTKTIDMCTAAHFLIFFSTVQLAVYLPSFMNYRKGEREKSKHASETAEQKKKKIGIKNVMMEKGKRERSTRDSDGVI